MIAKINLKIFIFTSLLLNSLFLISQPPLFSAFQLSLQNINPAYTGQNTKIGISTLTGYSTLGVNRSEGFQLKIKSNNQLITPPNFVSNPNYFNFNLTIPIYCKNMYSYSTGISIINNDLNELGTENISNFQFSLGFKLKKGTIFYGICLKRNTFKLSDKSVYYTFTPTHQVYINPYRELNINSDLGISFKNDSNTFDFGCSVFNLRKHTFAVNTIDNKFQLFYTSSPHINLSTNFSVKLSPKIEFQNGIVLSVLGNFKFPKSIISSVVQHKTKGLGLGMNFIYSQSTNIGPTLILTKRRFKCIYSYNLNSLKYSIIPGFHEIGFRLDIL
jgi:hypothetical protein